MAYVFDIMVGVFFIFSAWAIFHFVLRTPDDESTKRPDSSADSGEDSSH